MFGGWCPASPSRPRSTWRTRPPSGWTWAACDDRPTAHRGNLAGRQPGRNGPGLGCYLGTDWGMAMTAMAVAEREPSTGLGSGFLPGTSAWDAECVITELYASHYKGLVQLAAL